MSGKWLEVLKDISPDIERVAVVFNPETAAGHGTFFLDPIKASAPSFAVRVLPAPVQNDADIERVIAEFARDPNGGLIVTLDAFTAVHRDASSLRPRHARYHRSIRWSTTSWPAD